MSRRQLTFDPGQSLIYTLGASPLIPELNLGFGGRSRRLLVLRPGQPIVYTLARPLVTRRAALRWFPGLDPRYPR